MQDNKGFTLIELLTALAIGAILLLAVTTTIFALNRAYERASLKMEQQRALRKTMDLLRREISSAVYRTDDKLLRFQVQDRDYYGKPASNLYFSTIAPPLEGDASDQLIVAYNSKEQEGKHIILSRSGRDYFLDDSVKTLDYGLLENLEGFLVECFDGSKWVKTWDTELTRRLPRQVRVTITLPDADKSVSFQLLATPRIDQQ